eukprot:TRINITY_DN3101_c0_g1_i3.p1 TRINITY_DN3101_c0_g1~~TRINITY_DN3101_c0_g1_i3.p1  ORF type:complete len:289 (+),score=96.26 TRINITY_DN3101_c0_g1_i3:145-1011(+)
MADRKVLNKYYPPTFDPELLPRGRGPKLGQKKVRLMLPMNVQCLSCGEYIAAKKKFNGRKEDVEGEKYLGQIQIFRFYMRCPRCSKEFTILTDPGNSDYKVEHGVKRMFEAWKEEDAIREEYESARRAEDGDPMQALEARTLDSKHEMDMMDTVDEIRSLQAQRERISHDALIKQYETRMQDDLQIEELDDDEYAMLEQFAEEQRKHDRSIMAGVSTPNESAKEKPETKDVEKREMQTSEATKRNGDDDDGDDDDLPKVSFGESLRAIDEKRKTKKRKVGILLVKKKT